MNMKMLFYQVLIICYAIDNYNRRISVTGLSLSSEATVAKSLLSCSHFLHFSLLVIEEQKQKTFEEVTNRHWETRLAEWDTEKGRILNALLGSDDSLNISIVPSKKSKVRDDSKVIAGKRSLLDDNEMLYAQQIHRYNEMVVQVMQLPNVIKKPSLLGERSRE